MIIRGVIGGLISFYCRSAHGKVPLRESKGRRNVDGRVCERRHISLSFDESARVNSAVITAKAGLTVVLGDDYTSGPGNIRRSRPKLH